MNILVIDTGTSSMRGILYSPAADILCSHQVTYQVQYPKESYAEQDPQDWKSALFSIVKIIASYAKEHDLSIDAITTTCQRSSVIPVDISGNPLSSAIMWLDKRTQFICRDRESCNPLVFSKTGSRINTVFAAPKMTWIRENQPDIYQQTYKFLTIADYLTFLMTGHFITDHTYGSRSLLMNLYSRKYDAELLDLFHVEESKLCPLTEPGSILGSVTSEFSRITGIQEGIPVISGGGDQQCAALGHGVITPGSMEITSGTGAYILAYTDAVPSSIQNNVVCQAHAIKGKYVLESSILACASSYNWALDIFYSPQREEKISYKQINHDVSLSPPGSKGCIALPYFQGRGTPDWNSSASGAFINLSFQHKKGDMIRSILESTAFELQNNIEILEKYTGSIRQISIGGGLTNFSIFNQIQADVFQKRLLHFSTNEQTSLGAFINAAVALGEYSSYENALAAVRSHLSSTEYIPNTENKSLYERQRIQLNSIYKKLCIL